MNVERNILGFPIRAQSTQLDSGLDVSIYGGCATHVGAVTLAEFDGTTQTVERAGHKDSAISELWARELAKTMQMPVCVRCGIHYDHATKEQLAEITAGCNQMLNALTAALEQERNRS